MNATVTHIATGRTWTVPAFTSKPKNNVREGLRVASSTVVDGLLPCAGCGADTGVHATTVTNAATGRPTCVPAGQADRIVNDHPAFHVTVPVAYGPRTTANVCPADNGSAARKRPDVLAALEREALRLLDRP